MRAGETVRDADEDALLEEAGAGRAVARCDMLGQWPFSDSREHVFRPFLGSGHAASCELILGWMRAAGMDARLDPAGNLLGRYEGVDAGAPALLIGSHVDSVRDGGRYDGVLGVMLGIEVVDAFHRAGRRFPFALEVIGFGDEEGSRFPSYMLGSRAVADILPPHALEAVDADGMRLVDALRGWGIDPDRFSEARRGAGEILGYLEAHIEQAPLLERRHLPLGVVSSIAAQSRYYVTLEGVTTHAGTAMEERRDALAAAAEMIVAIEAIAGRGPDDLVATVGVLKIASGGATNIVSGAVGFSIDLRAAHRATRDDAARDIRDALARIASERRVGYTIDEVHALSGAVCDVLLNRVLGEAVRGVAGYDPPVMVSQAGHDGMNVASLAPITMLFIRCEGGISHNPAEAVMEGDVALALDAMVRFVETFAC